MPLPLVAVAMLGLVVQMPQAEKPLRSARPLVRARSGARITVDGRLDEPVWRAAPAATDFVQSEPREGAPASEATEVWVAYDETNLYVAAHLHDAERHRLVVNDIREDFTETDQDDFELLLDTFGDQRNGYVFITNVAGAKADR
ncbi:MAG: sugar-binding protein, partial [Gemmatimonadales bacterium]